MRMTDQDPMFNEDQMLMQGAEQEMQPQAGSIEAIDPLDRMPPRRSHRFYNRQARRTCS